MHGQLHHLLLGELQRGRGEQLLLRGLHQAGALPVLFDAFAYLRHMEHLLLGLWFDPVTHGDDLHQQLQLWVGRV